MEGERERERERRLEANRGRGRGGREWDEGKVGEEVVGRERGGFRGGRRGGFEGFGGGDGEGGEGGMGFRGRGRGRGRRGGGNGRGRGGGRGGRGGQGDGERAERGQLTTAPAITSEAFPALSKTGDVEEPRAEAKGQAGLTVNTDGVQSPRLPAGDKGSWADQVEAGGGETPVN